MKKVVEKAVKTEAQAGLSVIYDLIAKLNAVVLNVTNR